MDNTLTTELFHIVSISLDISISISIVSLSLYIFLLKKYARTDRKTRISRCGSSGLSSKGGSRARAGLGVLQPGSSPSVSYYIYGVSK